MGCASSRSKPSIHQIDYSPVVDAALGRAIESEYAKPRVRDMAIGLVFFNMCKSKKLLMNYLYTVEKLKLANIPYFTLELCFDKPEIKDAFHVTGRDALFHKESLFRLLEKKIPAEFTKLCCMDCDILFQNVDWYNETSALLSSFEVVQPFETCKWLDSTYQTVTLERRGVARAVATDQMTIYDSKLHPGFVWAFQRAWYVRNGFYDLSITGSGDTLSAAAWMNVDFPPNYLQRAYAKTYADYRRSLKIPSMTYLPGTIEHLWHGTKENRKYMDRHNILKGVDELMDILEIHDGILSVKDDRVKEALRAYFVGRFDDGV